MIWILKLILLFSLHAKAQVQAPEASLLVAANPSAEMAVTVPGTESSAADSIKVETATQSLKETEIPVHLEPVKKAASSENSIFKFVLTFGIIGVLGCAAFFLIRKYRFKNPQSQATQIKVLSQHYLGPKKSLAIVRVAGESVLIGITDHNISMIKSLSLLDEDIPEEAPQEFQSIFAKKTKAHQVAVSASEEAESKDEFSISGIKDFVSVKLKNMRSLE